MNGFFFFLKSLREKPMGRVEAEIRGWFLERSGAQGRLNLAQRDTLGMFIVNHVFYHFGRYFARCF